jgi:pilus assembly protein TadC
MVVDRAHRRPGDAAVNALLAVGLAAAAAALLAVPAEGRPARRRLAALHSARSSGLDGATPPPEGSDRRQLLPTLLVIGTGVVTAAAVGGMTGLVAGPIVAVGLAYWLRTRSARAGRARARETAAELPLALDLLAAALAAGVPIAHATEAVAQAAGPRLRDRLKPVAALLRAGAPAAEAWAPWSADPALAPVGRAMVRAGQRGSAPAAAVARLAARQRAAARTEANRAAQTASVFAVLPLGLCFLPAFVLVGVVPIVIGLVRHAF